MRDHHHHIEVSGCSPARVFQALITPSDICQWWGASRVVVIPGQGGMWCATWGENEDHPEYVTAATISKFEPEQCLRMSDFVYQSPEGGLPSKPTSKLSFGLNQF